MSMQKDGMLLKVACAFGALACGSTQTQAQPIRVIHLVYRDS